MGLLNQELTKHPAARKNAAQGDASVARCPSKAIMLWKSGLRLLNLLLRLRFSMHFLSLLGQEQHVPQSKNQLKSGFYTSDLCATSLWL